jgi:hypothetical protein
VFLSVDVVRGIDTPPLDAQPCPESGDFWGDAPADVPANVDGAETTAHGAVRAPTGEVTGCAPDRDTSLLEFRDVFCISLSG